MAKVSNAFTTYAAQANREQLANVIYNIDPFDTPIMNAIGRRNVSGRIFDWQTESLPAVDDGNAREEGFELSRSASTPTVRVSNTTQISSRDATVTGSQEAADAAGKKSELAHQMALVSKALKRDMEKILSGAQARNDGNDTAGGTARKTRAIEHWITTNVSYGSGGANPASATATVTDGTRRNLTEAMFNDALEQAYTAGAEPKVAIVAPPLKRKISAFTGRTGSQIPISKAEVINSVDVYKSDFGDIRIQPSRWVRNRTVMLLDPEYAALAFFRNFTSKDLATVGDAETKMILAEWGVEMKNEAAHAKIADVQ